MTTTREHDAQCAKLIFAQFVAGVVVRRHYFCQATAKQINDQSKITAEHIQVTWPDCQVESYLYKYINLITSYFQLDFA